MARCIVPANVSSAAGASPACGVLVVVVFAVALVLHLPAAPGALLGLAAGFGLPHAGVGFLDLGALALEHNYEEPKRTQLVEFLAARGYRRTHSYRQDDFYAPAAAR